MTFHREGKATLIVSIVTGVAITSLLHALIPGWGTAIGVLLSLVLLGLVINFFRMPSR